ncbi:Homeobox protein ESX1 [Camelus dromedarius]|uniref:Homeobox protein ESX1 n=3 Tax=Camelus TaxID=9836 RepID=A0A5N4C2K2_CAMDR|nr:rhox homeobox family member 1-like [Camelus dromedarius]XP_032331302.1 rhox homeobox family member 1-like [Camelus ferus]KAB1253081.1 Homeobox protein ESX1 [Camelus dromedarius]
MEPPPRRSHEDAGYLSLGVEELQEEPHDTKPTAATSVIVTGKAVEEDPRPEPEQGAAAAEQGRVGAGAPGPMDDENQKGGGGGGEESPQQEQELAHAATEDPEREGSQLFFPCNPYGWVQLKDLERIFQRSQYPDVFARTDVTIRMDVTEAEGQVSKPEKNNLPE